MVINNNKEKERQRECLNFKLLTKALIGFNLKI